VIWKLEPFWLFMAIAAVSVMGFMFGSALNAVMRDDGFGSTGNMALFVAGFFTAILGANFYGISLRELGDAVAWGLGGAFASVAICALLKAGAGRLT